jgi:hypothetical protein
MFTRIEASNFERDLVRTALAIAAENRSQFLELQPARRSCHPLPFFGSIDRAKVITLGLNPSAHEFLPTRNWSKGTEDWIAGQLVNYWNNVDRSPHSWFQPWSTVLSHLGIAYASSAAHTDLSPRATNSRKAELMPLFLSMLRQDAPIWIEALSRASACRLVLAAGSATKKYYLNEFVSLAPSEHGGRLGGDWQRKRGAGQTVFQTIYLPNGREIPFFFCSTGPTVDGGSVLVKACLENIGILSKHLRDKSAWA